MVGAAAEAGEDGVTEDIKAQLAIIDDCMHDSHPDTVKAVRDATARIRALLDEQEQRESGDAWERGTY